MPQDLPQRFMVISSIVREWSDILMMPIRFWNKLHHATQRYQKDCQRSGFVKVAHIRKNRILEVTPGRKKAAVLNVWYSLAQLISFVFLSLHLSMVLMEL